MRTNNESEDHTFDYNLKNNKSEAAKLILTTYDKISSSESTSQSKAKKSLHNNLLQMKVQISFEIIDKGSCPLVLWQENYFQTCFMALICDNE